MNDQINIQRCFFIIKVVSLTESYQLPPPIIEVIGEHTKVTLFSYKPFGEMNRTEKIHACYLHACLKYVTREHMTKASLRKRFRLENKDNSVASRIIRDAVESGEIKPFDPNTAPRYMKYVPFWA